MGNWRSKEILNRPKGSKVRALLKAAGYSDFDLDRPLIGIANSWNTVVSGHTNLRLVAEHVKQGILQAGGTPAEFGVIGGCDGVASGHEGMRYILPSRDIIASSIEIMVQAHRLDGVVLVGSCDKVVPGMLMAAARLDLPAIVVVGGPAEGGCLFDGRSSDTTSIAEALGMLQVGKISEETFYELEDSVMPTCGSCSFLGTANTMGCVAEALGMSLPGTATIPATHSERYRTAQEAGRRIVTMIEEGLTARKIINAQSIENAVRVTAAVGGSTNVALHLPAIAYEADCPFSMEAFDALCRSTPLLAKINPASSHNMGDFHAAGGVCALMKEILPLLHREILTVSGKTVRENASAAVVRNRNVIRPLSEPWSSEGGLAVLKGNLAPNTGITKPAAIHPSMWTFSGKARCFDGEEAATQAIVSGLVKEGDVIVIRYEGPKGGPGMREMATAMKLLYGRGLARATAVITDGRFSGTNNGCFVGHISPEAAEGGPLAAVKDEDLITIDIPKRSIHLHVSHEEIRERMKTWKRPAGAVTKGYLELYSRLASSASEGAVLKLDR